MQHCFHPVSRLARPRLRRLTRLTARPKDGHQLFYKSQLTSLQESTDKS